MDNYLVIQTIFIYSFIGLILFTCCYYGRQQKNWSYVVAGLLVYALIFGLRYGVGRDYFNYVDNFIAYSRSGATDRVLESGFDFYIKIFTTLGLPQWLFFGVLAFAQIFFVFKAFKDERFVWPSLALVFVLNCEWLSYANVIRQSLAFAFFAYAVSLAEKKKKYLYCIFILLAVSVHASSVVLLFLYPLIRFKRVFFKKILLEIGLFLLAVFLGLNDFVQNIMQYLEVLLTSTRYQSYLYTAYAGHLDRDVNVGLGYVIGVLINFFLIVKSNEIKKFYKSDKLNFIYDMYFVGALVFYTFFSSRIIQRMALYFYGFAFVIGAFTLYYLSKNKKNLQYMMLLFLYLLIFVAYMYKMDVNSVAFRFIWQERM